MSDDREEYEGDLLTQANNLNGAIKDFLANNHGDGVSTEGLESFKTDILGYLVDIGNEEFEEPRPDRLTKEGIEHDLKTHLTMINSLLSRAVGRKGKKRSRSSKRSGKKRSGKKRSSKRRRSNKRKRSSKRRRNSRKRRKY
jgi:hypothetical protein